jgi:hypothetical protein
MGRIAALYLAHLSPMTKAHESIISVLRRDYAPVYVFPVRFIQDNREINTKSFPFSFDQRKEMVEATFGNSVEVLSDYTFYAPFSQYLPPLLSSKSWQLRNQIVSHIKEDKFVSYTGDTAERVMLKIYGLHPLKARRLEISGSSVKEMLYREVIEGDPGIWRSMVPSATVKVIEDNWSSVERFAKEKDDTTKRVMGMKFPREGYK